MPSSSWPCESAGIHGEEASAISDYRIVVHRSRRLIGQKFWVSIVAANGKTLFHSEQLKNLHYARELAHQIAAALDGNYIDLAE